LIQNIINELKFCQDYAHGYSEYFLKMKSYVLIKLK